MTSLPGRPIAKTGGDLTAHDVDMAHKVVRSQAQPLTPQFCRLLTSRGSHPAQQPKNEKNDENGSKNAAADIHVILLDT